METGASGTVPSWRAEKPLAMESHMSIRSAMLKASCGDAAGGLQRIRTRSMPPDAASQPKVGIRIGRKPCQFLLTTDASPPVSELPYSDSQPALKTLWKWGVQNVRLNPNCTPKLS